MKTIDTRFYNQDQSWWFERIVKLDDGQKLKVVIRRNAYDFQSSAVCKRWDGNKWHLVNSMPIKDCACKPVSYVDKSPNKALFEKDAKALIAIAKEIVS